MTGGYKGLEGNTLCLQGVRRGDRGLKRVTGVTRGDRGLQEVTGGYTG